ncbi:glycine--tRNA ligase subunit beta [Oceanomicrobium pacificus]|uniref:Glycine--tRNA ligase beta subunit n=1 Tax=Oceanomicrobium pacificus TaxID=2692916 RepID=A0A6B0TNR7_9RHOB|nr:glycine--tRNA ligase subunit beta [Oceanomicrobium pacificus]MXU65516.1 glycine--tRNA ligase subunit beta [Oceanomicrobium pacificus]
MPDLLLELFSEEIPARMQARAAADLKKLVTDGLVEAGLTYAAAESFATPRRLTLAVHDLLGESPTTVEERKGPRTDAPEKAIEGFLRSTGLSRDALEVRDDKKGQVFFATIRRPGRPAAEIIAETVTNTIRTFPWPKSMRWGAGSLRWVRPLHSILCILSDEAGAELVPFEVDGIESGTTTQGHRFMGHGTISVTGFEDYAAKLKAAHVILDPQERADRIWEDARQMAFAQGLDLVEDRGLLAEVAGLVEWPVVLMGDIADTFLDLPPEVLQTSMKEHQKFFSVRNPKTGRIEKFVTVANRETADQGATILAGNGKVLSARLADAKFFWDNDLRRVAEGGLDAMATPLAQVTFHNKLGSQADRIARIEALSGDLAGPVGAEAGQAQQAARIVKADLSSEMVYEFPELQGVMGGYYARAAGLPDAVADACTGHYQPLGASDSVPEGPVSVAVALADKLDILTGFWSIDEKPTGSKDPFALRRAALGVIRIIEAGDLRLPLRPVIVAQLLRHEIAQAGGGADADTAALNAMLDDLVKKGLFGAAFDAIADRLAEHGGADRSLDAIADDLLSFIHDRLTVHLRDQGIRHDVIAACLAMPGSDDLTLLMARARSLSAFLGTDDGENLLQGFKRANNILTAEEKKDGIEYSLDPDVKFAEEPTEKSLFAALDRAEPAIATAMGAEDFAAAMQHMAELRAPIDAFFEAVQVNSDNQIVRRNRLCLLNRIRQVMGQVADFTRLEG